MVFPACLLAIMHRPPQCLSTSLLDAFSGWLVGGPTLRGWAWLWLSQRRPQLGCPRGFCWFSLWSLEQEKRKEACVITIAIYFLGGRTEFTKIFSSLRSNLHKVCNFQVCSTVNFLHVSTPT